MQHPISGTSLVYWTRGSARKVEAEDRKGEQLTGGVPKVCSRGSEVFCLDEERQGLGGLNIITPLFPKHKS